MLKNKMNILREILYLFINTNLSLSHVYLAVVHKHVFREIIIRLVLKTVWIDNLSAIMQENSNSTSVKVDDIKYDKVLDCLEIQT